jgi:[acyl-carrier-protein] S-malonyltransferase
MRAFVFPGQGSQAVGMGRELAESLPTAREVFEEVDDALGQRLSRLMFEGPEAELVLTANAQPALMAVSVAAVRVLGRDAGVDLARACRFVAGHSLGEYSALCAAGAIALADVARLLRRRGQAMQEAVPVGVGAMAALLGLELEQAREVVEKAAAGEVLDAANDNAPGQVVVSGHRTAVERAIEVAKAHGARRSILLPVSAPFHCRLMQPAAEAMQEALERVAVRSPAVPLVANVTASAVRDPDEIRRLLVAQVTGLVRWRESVLFMRQAGVETLVEVGAGKVLSGLARRIDRDLAALSVGTPAEVDAFVKSL